ncbi:MAG: hypothetical protein GF375_04080 [Candidatus Omnitrophica bacterium]|nr:hypothetical protein [Candidatus Omnitrophota bacterium]
MVLFIIALTLLVVFAMSASDWDLGTQNTVSPSIVADGDFVLEVDFNPGGGPAELFDMFYNGDVNIGPNTEIDFKIKALDNEQFQYSGNPKLWFRADGIDINALTGIGVWFKGSFSGGWWRAVDIYKYDGGTPTLLNASGNLHSIAVNTWYRYRVRVWDTIFPANNVRYSVELWTGAAWNLLLQYDDATAWAKGVTGRFGTGGRGSTAVLAQKERWNDLAIGEMS